MSATVDVCCDVELYVEGKKYTISALELSKHPNSLLLQLATADYASSSSSSSAPKVCVLQLDSMKDTPLAEWPHYAAPIICSMYRSGSITEELLDSLLKHASGTITDTQGSINHVVASWLNRLLDYLQLLDMSEASSRSSISKWLLSAASVPLLHARVLPFIYHCFAADALRAMLRYKSHSAMCGLKIDYNRPRSAAFLISNDRYMLSHGLGVHALPGAAGDIAAGGLCAAAKAQVFDDSNKTIMMPKISTSTTFRYLPSRYIPADRVVPPVSREECIFTTDEHKPCVCHEPAQDIQPHAVGVVHPVFGAALKEALAAAVEGTGLYAGFTWAEWPSKLTSTPCWVLWW